MSQRSSFGRPKRPDRSQVTSDIRDAEKKQKSDLKNSESDTTKNPQAQASDRSPNRKQILQNSNRDNRTSKSRKSDARSDKRSDRDRGGSSKPNRIEVSDPKLFQGETLIKQGHGAGSIEFVNSGYKRELEHKAFTDESKLSKLVRKLTREDDRERRLVTIKLLSDYLVQPENMKGIIRQADHLLNVFLDIFNERVYRDVKEEVAGCMGILGSVMGMDVARYFQWIFTKVSSASSEDVKIFLLSALLETIGYDEGRLLLQDHMPNVMSQLQVVLENADTPDLLIAAVEVILRITKNYPHIFASHFSDTVDILVGWHIDATQKDHLTQFCSDALVSFHEFWAADMTFSLTLLGQFIEDIEAYAEDLELIHTNQVPQGEELPSPEECAKKITALLRVFTTVVRSLGSYFTPTVSSTVTVEYVTELLVRITKCLDMAVGTVFCEEISKAGNLCLGLLVSHLQGSALQCADVLLNCILNQINRKQLSTNGYSMSLLELVQKVIEQIGTKLPVTFISKLLGPDSLLTTLRFSQNAQVLGYLMPVYHTVMGLKSVPLLQEAYRYVLGDIQVAFNCLLSKCKSSVQCDVVSDNPYVAVEYTTRQAESVIVFSMCALAEIGNTKSNLIGMYALTPSIFDLFATHLRPFTLEIGTMYPAASYAVLQTLYSHCCRHGHFISSSDLISQKTTNFSAVNTTGHLTTILSLLAELLGQRNAPVDTRYLTMKWCSEILNVLQTTPAVFSRKEILDILSSLLKLGYNKDIQVSLSVCQCLIMILKADTKLSMTLLRKCYNLCLVHITASNTALREEYFKLLKCIPLDLTTRLTFEEIGKPTPGVPSLQTSWLARRIHMSKPATGNLHTYNFKSIMAFLLLGRQSSDSTDWLERLFHNCQRLNKTRTGNNWDIPSLSMVADGNEASLWFWATWEAAQYCVMTRLRTALGKPQETFMAIEDALKRYGKQLKQKEEENGHVSSGDDDHTCFSEHLRVNLLIQFMEHLEKLLYNAYEGCAVAMATAPKVVRTFFRTNRATCMEWLHRNRLVLIQVALHAGNPAVVVRQGFELLKEWQAANRTFGHDFEHALMYLVEALIELHCPEAIQGLYAWCKEITGKKLAWIKAAVEKAAGRYETAANSFSYVLKNYIRQDGNAIDDKISPTGSPQVSPKNRSHTDSVTILGKAAEPDNVLASFMVDQVTDSYLKLNNYEEVLKWQETLHELRSENSGNSVQNALVSHMDMNVRALSKFNEHDFIAVRGLLEMVPGGSVEDPDLDAIELDIKWDVKEILETAQLQLVRLHTKVATEACNGHNLAKCLEQCGRLCEDVLRIKAMEWPAILSPDAMLQSHAVNLVKTWLRDDKDKLSLLPLSEDLHVNVEDHDISVVTQTLRLTELQELLRSQKGWITHNSEVSNIKLAAVNLARKQTNYKLAERLLLNEMQTVVSNQLILINPNDPISQALTSVQSCNGDINEIHMLKIERETAKLLQMTGQSQQALDVISESVVRHANQLGESGDHKLCGEINSRSLLSLVKWLQLDPKVMSSLVSQLKSVGQGDTAGVAFVVTNLRSLMEFETYYNTDMTFPEHQILSDTDLTIGRLLHLSTLQSPGLAKAWFSFAGWCYRWGRKTIDTASHGSIELTDEEKEQVLSVLPTGMQQEDIDGVLNVLSQIHTGISGEEDISDQDQSLYDDTATETTRRQLLSSCPALQIASEDCIEQLLNIWTSVVARVYHYYKVSAKAYFTYLKLNDGTQEQSHNEDGNVTATLRLLRLLVKHAWELRDILEDGLAQTPTGPWKGIIPQLFSRLNHPESYVRQSISDLLCRVAQDAPHLIVYPAVVGCATVKQEEKDNTREGLLNNYLESSEQDGEDQQGVTEVTEENEEEKALLRDCFIYLVDTLASHSPQMISEVQLFVQELRRITLLWDELWLGTLNQQHLDLSRRISQMENEVKKAVNNASLTKEEKTTIIREKHNIIFKPVLFTLEKLCDITIQAAETPNEQWFQETYSQMIFDAIDRLQNPPNPSNPQNSCQGLKQLHRSLQERSQKRSSLVLKMDEISSKLAEMNNTAIAIPGISTMGEAVTIKSIHNNAQILPTKTKPKKLVFIGSDGRKYPYLFKGLEDLHLDERIMQFLSIVNNMFARSDRGSKQIHRARHYSVTPLGLRSGLIQWVDGATPLFGLYKRWQQREATAQAIKAQTQGQNTQTNVGNVARPSEVYYSKLTPLLKEKGVTNMESRREWPLSVLVQVLEKLMADTPADLLARELWCSSTSASEWWQVTQTYSRSTAVMSMIGYIIGLGDRHLDNVLVDLGSGEVIHIDYNVCFEKGKSLRVPEKVPFRMTPNIESALGVTGVEGTFRTSCENVIKTMRKGRETLLTLLEAFVYDPLVDWTTGNESGYAGAFYGGGLAEAGGDERQNRKDMERDIAMSMFSVRVAEMKADWIQNRQELEGSIPNLMEALQVLLKAEEELCDTQSSVAQFKDQKSFLQDAKNNMTHELYTLSQRYEEHSVVKATRTTVLEAVQEKMNECENWQRLHESAIQIVQSQRLQQMCAEVSVSLSLSIPSFATAIDFLQGAGQGQMVSQCEQLERELSGILIQRRSVVAACLDVLHTYGTIVSQYPKSYAKLNRSYNFQNWLQELVCEFTSSRVKEVQVNFQTEYRPTPAALQASNQAVLSTEVKLQTVVQDANNRLVKLMERRGLDPIDSHLLGGHMQDTEHTIEQYVHENGGCGKSSLTCVIVTALCSLNKRYLIMENAAAAAGDRLMDLTSRDGDWFLDELCSLSGYVNQLLSLLKDNPAESPSEMVLWQQTMLSMKAIHQIYVALQELNVNFRSIILPESLKTIQGHDSSVMAVLEQLDSLVEDCGYPFDKLIMQLEKQLRNVIMGMESENPAEVTIAVKEIKTKFDHLLQGADLNSTELTPGQMLVMGFNGLFTRLTNDFNDMLEVVLQIQVPDVWKKIDVVREAKGLQKNTFTEATLSLLADIFFLKRVQTMQEFFDMAQQMANTLQGNIGGEIFDDEQLAKPIKCFVSDFVRKQIIGLPSCTLGYTLCTYINSLGVDVTAEIELRDIGASSKVSIEDLCKKAVDFSLKNGLFQHVHLTEASALTSSHDLAWRKQDLAKRLDSNIVLCRCSLQRSQLQLSRYQWLHEDIFTRSGRTVKQMTMPLRATVMSEMRKSVQALVSHETNVIAIQDKYLHLEAGIAQRLKWASGANPSLHQVLQDFEEAQSKRGALIQTEGRLANDVSKICNGILHFEANRTRTSEAMSADNNFFTLLNKCEESCVLLENCDVNVTEIEERLMEIKPLKPGQKINNEWIKAVLDKTNKEISNLCGKLNKLKTSVDTCREGVGTQVNVIKNLLTAHQKLMSEVKSIMKSLAKYEEQDFGQEVNSGGVRDYMNKYKIFTEDFSNLLKLATSDTMDQTSMSGIETTLTSIEESMSCIYSELTNFATPLKVQPANLAQHESPQLSFATALKRPVDKETSTVPKKSSKSSVKSELLTGTPPGSPLTNTGKLMSAPATRRQEKSDKITRDPRTGKAIQERNSYAVSVWRRVKMKLDGRDPETTKRLSVPEQVDYVIKEATNIENLAVLYEGWTPWV